MGQYYKPTVPGSKQYVYSHDHDSGLKLMEHSYLDNPMMGVVEALLSKGGEWHKKPLVWAGDYADEEYSSGEEGKDGPNLYDLAENRITTKERAPGSILVNHTKKEAINLDDVREKHPDQKWAIHPLPLLTCEGNGRGGGDFHYEDARIGTWARDIISMEMEVPNGYRLVDGVFIEA